MATDPDLVTGDAVVLDLREAKLASRGLALAVDVLVQLALLFVIGLLLLWVAELDGALLGALSVLFAVLVLVGYPATCETLSRGRTLGKLALGLRAVREDGGPLRFRHALTRALAGVFVDFWMLGLFGAVAVIVSLSSRRGKRVGDYLAGTVVVRERAPDSTPVTIHMPPELAHWASQLDLSNLPAGLAMAVRQYLGRYRQLSEAAREELARGLAEDVAACTGAAVPPGVPRSMYLSAVLAELRGREYARQSGTASQAEPARPRAPVERPSNPWPQDESGGPFAPPG